MFANQTSTDRAKLTRVIKIADRIALGVMYAMVVALLPLGSVILLAQSTV